jgi:hypothetical protein
MIGVGIKRRNIDDDDDDVGEQVHRETTAQVAEILRQFEGPFPNAVFNPPPLQDAATVYDALVRFNFYPALEAFLPLFVNAYFGHLTAAERKQV